MQFEGKCFKEDSDKLKQKLLRVKFYNKTADLIQKESVGKSIGSHCDILLAANSNPSKLFS